MPVPFARLPSTVATILADDPESTRTVYLLIAGLVVLGLGMIALAVWLVRSTRHDHQALAPLELMGNRRWRRSDPVWQRRQLDDMRPPGAEPLATIRPVPLVTVDLRAMERDAPQKFDDLAIDAPLPLVAADEGAAGDAEDVDASTVTTGADQPAAEPGTSDGEVSDEPIELTEPNEAKEDAKEAAKEAKEDVKEDAKEDAKEAKEDVKEDAKEPAGLEDAELQPAEVRNESDPTPERLLDPLLELFRSKADD